jgi:rhamnosyl/mannosyltransferase
MGIDLEPLLAIERDYAGQSGSPLILAAGRLSSCKGFPYLIEAMERVNGRLVIAGDGEMGPTLETQIRRLGLEGRVRLAGQVSRQTMLNWYARADVFCLPACEESEGFGLSMPEAMAAGLPVVGTHLPAGVRSVNVHGETGLAVRPGDTAALAAALDLLANDANLRRRMGMAARRRARQEFGRKRMGQRMVDLYREILSPATTSEVEYAFVRR